MSKIQTVNCKPVPLSRYSWECFGAPSSAAQGAVSKYPLAISSTGVRLSPVSVQIIRNIRVIGLCIFRSHMTTAVRTGTVCTVHIAELYHLLVRVVTCAAAESVRSNCTDRNIKYCNTRQSSVGSMALFLHVFFIEMHHREQVSRSPQHMFPRPKCTIPCELGKLQSPH